MLNRAAQRWRNLTKLNSTQREEKEEEEGKSCLKKKKKKKKRKKKRVREKTTTTTTTTTATSTASVGIEEKIGWLLIHFLFSYTFTVYVNGEQENQIEKQQH